jgi:6-phosphogluconolactonase
MSRAVAKNLSGLMRQSRDTAGRFSLAVSGGTTPRTLYRLLGGEFRQEIPWSILRIFWADERYVPPNDARNNFRLVYEAVIRHVPIESDHVHPMPTHYSNPDDASGDYESLLRREFSGRRPRFDVILLGMGTDGHTASLFPGSEVLQEAQRWVVSVRAATEPATRLTLTLPVLNAAHRVYFLVSGEEKADVLRAVLEEGAGAPGLPAGAVRPAHGELVWWTDAAAAKKLPASWRDRD